MLRDIKKSHLSLVPQISVDENTANALKTFDSVKSINLNEAKKYLSDNRNLYMSGAPVSIPELCAVEKACIKAKRAAVSNSNERLSCEIDEMLINAYTMMDFLLPTLELTKHYYNTYYESKLNDSTETLIDVLEKRYGTKESTSEEVTCQNYFNKAEEVYQNFNNHGTHWAATANYADAHRAIGKFDKAFNLSTQAELLINGQYSEADKRTNPILCYPEYAQGNIKLISAIDQLGENLFKGPSSDSKSKTKNVLNIDELKIAEKKFSELQRLGYSSSEFLNSLGTIQELKHNYGEALLYYADSIELNINNIHPWANAYFVFLNHKRYDEAILILDHMAIISPESQDVLNAVDAYQKATGIELAIINNKNLSESSVKLTEEQIEGNLEGCLETIKDTSWLQTNHIETQKMEEAGDFIKKAYDILDLAVSNGSIEDFLSAEDLLLKSVGIQILVQTNLAFFDLYYEMGIYEPCVEAYENIPYEYRKMLPPDKIKKVNYYIENPLKYAKKAEKAVENFSKHWSAYSNLGYAYMLAAVKEEDSKVKAGLLNKSYFNYVGAQKKLEVYLKTQVEVSKKDNKAQEIVTPYMCRPFLGQAYVKFLEFEEGLKNETELELCLAEAAEKFEELNDMGYEHSDISYAMGVISYADGDRDTAFEYLEHSIKLNPKNINAWIEYAAIYLCETGIEDAVPYLKEAMAIDPQNKKLLGLASEFELNLSKLNKQKISDL